MSKTCGVFRWLLITQSCFLCFAAARAEGIPGEVACKDLGPQLETARQLVDKVVTEYKKDRAKTIADINGGKTYRDGEYYVFVCEETKFVAHGFNSMMVGKDSAGIKDIDGLQFVVTQKRIALEKEEGCLKYHFPNPAHGGINESKIGYVKKIDDRTWIGSGFYLPK